MIEITDVAAKKIQSLMAKQGISEGGLRVGVKGGGCSGLSYTFAWEKQARLGDEVFEGHGAKIFVDKKSLSVSERHDPRLRHRPAGQRLRVQQPQREAVVRVR